MGRKAKTTPASSKKALEVCGDTSKLGVSAADIFAHFASPSSSWTASEESPTNAPVPPVGLDDKEISMALHSLQKKDPTTRLRGVGELQQLLSSRPQEDLREVATPFLNIYRRLWPQDSEPRVREGIQRCLQTLVETLHRDFARHLRSAFPTWLCAMFDTHPEVSQAARRAFAASFQTDEKKRGVFRHCRAECLALLSANLRHSEQSLHEELGLTAGNTGDKNVALERQDRYARVVAASLSGLGELINICSASTANSQSSDGSSEGVTERSAPPPAGTLTDEDLAPFFTAGSPCALWLRLAPKQPLLVRRAAAECLARVFQSPAGQSSACASTQVRAGVLCTLGDEAVPPAIASILLCRFTNAGGEDCWNGVNIAKALWPQLIALAKRGAPREEGFLTRLPELLRVLPADAWVAGRGEALLHILLEALQAPRSPKAEIWRGYVAVVKAVDAGSAPVPALWRWAPIQLYLRGQLVALGKAPEQADAHPADCLPFSSLPGPAFTGLPAMLQAELPSLMRQAEDGEDMLDVFSQHAPPLDAALLMQVDVAKAWKSWIALLAELLRVPELAKELRRRAAELIAENFRCLMVSTMRLPVPGNMSEIDSVLDALGSFLSAEITPDQSWAPNRASELLEELKMPSELLLPGSEATSEECLLAWPLLPWWQAWLLADPSGKAASAIGARVIRPLLSAALRRHSKQFPMQKTRELLAQSMLQMPSMKGDASEEEAEAPPPLRNTVRLYLECLPAEMRAASSPVLEQAVDHLTQLVAQGDRSSEDAWKLALQPGDGALSADKVCECINVLMQVVKDQTAAGSPTRAFQLARICCEVLVSHAGRTDTGLGIPPSLQRSWEPVCRVVLSDLVHRGGGDSEDDQRIAWDLLPGLLAGVDTALVCGILGVAPEVSTARDSWVRAMCIASSCSGVHPVSLLCTCRGDAEFLELDGPIALFDLRRNALATAGALPLSTTTSLFAASEGERARQAFLLFWEVLLADAVLPELGVRTASVRSWFVAASESTQGQFLEFCREASATEGQKWWLCLTPQPNMAPDISCGYSLSVLKKVLLMLWEHLCPVLPAPVDLSDVLKGIPDCHQFGPNWGQTTAMVIEQHAYREEIAEKRGRVAAREVDEQQRDRLRALEQELSCVDSDQVDISAAADLSASKKVEALATRTKIREAIHRAISSQQVCSPLLHVATAVELWASRIPGLESLDEDSAVAMSEKAEDNSQATNEEDELKDKTVRELKQILSDRGITPALPPVEKQDYIAAIVAAAPQKSTESDDDLLRGRRGAKLIEGHERLLRWSQSSKVMQDRDAFAACTAAMWPAIAAATPEICQSSRVVTRMHRFALELLSEAKESKERTRCRGSPGGLKLVAALAQAELWPDSSWAVVLQAITDADILHRSESSQYASELAPPETKATAEVLCKDAVTAGDQGENVRLPVARVFVDDLLAAAARLLLLAPVTFLPKVVPLLGATDPGLQAAAACRLRLQNWVSEANQSTSENSSKVLQLQFEGVLIKEEVGPEDLTGDDAACRDVIFAVLLSAIGPELSAQAWAVDEALTDFLNWEAEVQHAQANMDASESASDGDTQEHIGNSAAASGAGELPRHCRQRCVATLAAWELVLLGLQNCRALDVEKSSSDESEPMALPDLVATALQVTPDQIICMRTRNGWPSVTAPPLEAPSPLPLLMRLVCHVLTCKRIADEVAAGEDGVEEVLRRVAFGVLPSTARRMSTDDFDLCSLAARVFYLVLRAMPAAARGFWERLPRRRDRDLVEQLVANRFAPVLAHAEVQGAGALLKSRAEKFPDVEALVVRRKEQIVLQLERDDLRAELCVQVPEAFPLRMAVAEQPEKMPGIPPKRIRNWMLQARQVLSGPRPPCVGRAMLMWARSFALFFDGVEDCPICYNVVHLSTQTIPRKPCPTCKHKFHNECLYHWFKTSGKTTCPLCNQPF